MKLPILLKISVRSILKNKIQSLISILGLGIGLGCVFLLLLLFIHENSFDRSIPHKENIYRILRGNDCRTTYELGNTIEEEIPAIKSFFRIHQLNQFQLKDNQNKLFEEKNLACADSSIYKFLGIQILKGKASLSKDEICISSSIATKYFGKENPINQTLKIKFDKEFYDLNVCGVYRKMSTYSSLRPNFIGHIDLLSKLLNKSRKQLGHYTSDDNNFKDWNHFDLHTYIRLSDGINPKDIEQKLQVYKNRTSHDKKKELDYKLQAISDIYLYSNNLDGNFYTRTGNPSELIYFLVISILILTIAIVNYIFLTKAKIELRLKDLGVQKAMGASKNNIFKQILFESNLLAIFSLIPASVVMMFGIPFINQTLNRNINVEVLSIWQSYISLVAVLVITGSIAGVLLGYRISKISSVELIKGKLIKRIGKKQWSNSFLIVHFTIFIILVVGILAIKKQLNFAQSGSNNINTDNVIICELNSDELSSKFHMIENEVKKIPGVLKVAGSSFIPPFKDFLPVKLQYENDIIRFDGLIMGTGMLDLLDIEIKEGKGLGNFHESRREMIFNETAAKEYNIKVGSLFNGFMVRGIVKDFNAHSFHAKIRPMVILQQDPQKLYLLAVKTNKTSLQQVQKKLSSFFKEIELYKTINIYTLQDQIDDFYKKEEQQVTIISAFSILAIALSIMGLLGMVLNSISLKRKEIGIRKANGAKTHEIIRMINFSFIKWVLFAFIIACPISWFAMNQWLQNFAYKTELSWWIFVLAGIIAMGIALLTVSWQSWRAARKNPVESLRYE
ncbi:FtsX-like permease family protein [Marinifilum fragile]|uniref:ABC transporter permease n=1 Tax=Marinifilum fragile TaxID=570161 RepID=UPI002AA92811|nr:FtsX-like permease family protein [Marinifilum fragile]